MQKNVGNNQGANQQQSQAGAGQSAQWASTAAGNNGAIAGATAQSNMQASNANAAEHFVRHGGVHFNLNATPQEINNFVRKLPAGKRDSLFEVMDHLNQAGLITITNDHVFADGEGVIHRGDHDTTTI